MSAINSFSKMQLVELRVFSFIFLEKFACKIKILLLDVSMLGPELNILWLLIQDCRVVAWLYDMEPLEIKESLLFS